jgi:PAS domain S-box-containing protein
MRINLVDNGEKMILMKGEVQMLGALFQYTSEGIIITDTEGKIVMVNPRAENLFGYAQEELLGKTIEILVPPHLRHRHVNNRSEYQQAPHQRPMGRGMVLYGQRKDGSQFPLEVSLSGVPTEEGNFVLSFVVDITERKQQEDALRQAHSELELRVRERTEELRQMMEQLERSRGEVEKALERERELNRMKSRFVSTASHEFRTPLGTILSSAALISRYTTTEDEEKRAKHIQRIKSSVNQLTELLNDFLSLEKLEEGAVRSRPEAIDLCAFTLETIEEIRALAKEGQEFSCLNETVNGQSVAMLDRQLTKIVISNLLSNAIKYSPENASIAVSLQRDAQSLVLSIRDCGIGIPDEDKPYLFERFFRAHNAGNIQGTGLGLNIVKRYVELMGGEIDFTSAVGVGSEFRIVFFQDVLPSP